MDSVQVKVQGQNQRATPVVVEFTGTAADLSKGQSLILDLTNIDVSDDTDLEVQLDNVDVMSVGSQGIFGGIVARDYTEEEIEANPEILVYRNRGDVIDALLEGTAAVSVGDFLCPDEDRGGLVKRTGDVVGIAAIALEAYSDATTALKKVWLTGDICQIDT